jgi:hypothetical protein
MGVASARLESGYGGSPRTRSRASRSRSGSPVEPAPARRGRGRRDPCDDRPRPQVSEQVAEIAQHHGLVDLEPLRAGERNGRLERLHSRRSHTWTPVR